jgi:hypothetical protein
MPESTPTIQEKTELIDRILKSDAFVRARRAGPLLRYFFDNHLRGIDHVPESVLDQEFKDLAIHDDSAPRAAVTRLRQLLGEYFSEEGHRERYKVECPQWSYGLCFSPHTPTPSDAFEAFWWPHFVGTEGNYIWLEEFAATHTRGFEDTPFPKLPVPLPRLGYESIVTPNVMRGLERFVGAFTRRHVELTFFQKRHQVRVVPFSFGMPWAASDQAEETPVSDVPFAEHTIYFVHPKVLGRFTRRFADHLECLPLNELNEPDENSHSLMSRTFRSFWPCHLVSVGVLRFHDAGKCNTVISSPNPIGLQGAVRHLVSSGTLEAIVEKSGVLPNSPLEGNFELLLDIIARDRDGEIQIGVARVLRFHALPDLPHVDEPELRS